MVVVKTDLAPIRCNIYEGGAGKAYKFVLNGTQQVVHHSQHHIRPCLYLNRQGAINRPLCMNVVVIPSDWCFETHIPPRTRAQRWILDI
jgi:hypothetical protein